VTDLTGYTPKIAFTKLVATAGTATLTIDGTLYNAGAADQYYDFPITIAQSAALAVDDDTIRPFAIDPAQTGYAYRWEAGASDGGTNCPTHFHGNASVKARGIDCTVTP